MKPHKGGIGKRELENDYDYSGGYGISQATAEKYGYLPIYSSSSTTPADSGEE
jgi:hypothetical protein